MIVNFKVGQKNAKADLSNPIDISLITREDTSFKAWYASEMKANIIRGEGFVGSVAEGGAVNFKELNINPHANMTHTESVGHISKEAVPVISVLNQFHFLAQLITIEPIRLKTSSKKPYLEGDLCILKSQIEGKINPLAEAIVIKTQHHYKSLNTKNYDNTNWPYLHEETTAYLRKIGIKHLLIDQPSVDKEFDEGLLLAHKAFWDYPSSIDMERTITEFIGVPDDVTDDLYLLNLSISNLKNDASPSRPVLFSIFY